MRAVRLARACPDTPRTAVLVALLSIVVLFALLLQRKTFSYLLTPLPLLFVLMADGMLALRDRLSPRLARQATAGLLLLTAGEAGAVFWGRHQRALQTTPYDVVMRQVGAHVPHDAVVVAPHRYWLGLRDRRVRTWLVPLMMTNPDTYAEPISLDAALARIEPDVLVLDEREFGGYFDRLADPRDPRHSLYGECTGFCRVGTCGCLAKCKTRATVASRSTA